MLFGLVKVVLISVDLDVGLATYWAGFGSASFPETGTDSLVDWYDR